MKAKILTLLVLFSVGTGICLASCRTDEGNTQLKSKTKGKVVAIVPDSAAYANLGKTMTDILFSPKKVRCYRVAVKRNVDKEKDIELQPHFVRDTLIAELDTKLTGILQYELLANGQNYKYDSLRVRSPYAPEIVFAFEKKKAVVYVLISPLNYTWSVVYDDKLQFNWNYEDKKAVQRLCKMFTE